MKKRIVCATCLSVLVLAGTASAQVTGGLKGGLNLANMSFSHSDLSVSPGNRTAWMAGAFVEFPLAKNLALQPEAIVSTKGATLSPGGSASVSINLTYVDVPVLLRLDVPTNGRTVPFVYAGPNVGFLLRAKAVATFGGSKSEEDMKKDMKSTEFGVALGGGVRFGSFLVEARYLQGLTNVARLDSGETGKATTRVFKVIAGVRF